MYLELFLVEARANRKIVNCGFFHADWRIRLAITRASSWIAVIYLIKRDTKRDFCVSSTAIHKFMSKAAVKLEDPQDATVEEDDALVRTDGSGDRVTLLLHEIIALSRLRRALGKVIPQIITSSLSATVYVDDLAALKLVRLLMLVRDNDVVYDAQIEELGTNKWKLVLRWYTKKQPTVYGSAYRNR